MNPSDGPDTRDEQDDLEQASENVLGGWPRAQLDDPPADPVSPETLDGDVPAEEPDDVAPIELPSDESEEPLAEDGADAVAAQAAADAPDAGATGEHAVPVDRALGEATHARARRVERDLGAVG